MSKYATKKATKQLQKIFDVLGEFGGVIETDDPRCYWSLDLEVEEIEGDIKTIQIGVFSDINGDIIYDPLFHLSLRCENGKIMETEIIECEETAIGESLSGEKNLVLILEIIRNCGKNVIGENKKNRTISVQYISMPYSPVSAGGCGFIDGKLGCLCLETKEEFYV